LTRVRDFARLPVPAASFRYVLAWLYSACEDMALTVPEGPI
jgi:hypothetical protein